MVLGVAEVPPVILTLFTVLFTVKSVERSKIPLPPVPGKEAVPVKLLRVNPTARNPSLSVKSTPELTSTVPRRVVPPTAPVKVISPVVPALKVRSCKPAAVPFSVPSKLMSPPAALPPALVVSTSTAPVSVVAEL